MPLLQRVVTAAAFHPQPLLISLRLLYKPKVVRGARAQEGAQHTQVPCSSPLQSPLGASDHTPCV